MDLFVIYIGGTHRQSLIELHDMRFIAANNIEDTYDALRQGWWGVPSSLHLDAWGILDYADGHSIHISELPSEQVTNKLYFVNLGGYDPCQFTELHKNIFVVAPDEHQAKQKALQHINDWHSPHRDYLHQVDSILDLNDLVSSNNHYLHLTEEKNAKPFEFTCRYIPIGKKAE
ncbi:DUF1543 domain-containing protein [Legionella maioricensis]|uniref:DUF1543 domain-containing protein n=1 Tax=Legionella maioricensis TaxID=2896528 RepID=A0A9X2D187_9GAMM|nr:DUF1543 domain-containing protein [Legionella maioricensis]MCL9684745.1 DUF1543 domain-containing protein [Legionella maioricensis]MCL9687773.1 DUF1543 domain-containing protein [Legionella maioricensis]